MSDKEQPKQSRFVDADEIVSEFGICVRTLRRWIDAGIFPKPFRIGLRKRAWLRVDFEDYITAMVAKKEQSNEKIS